MHFRIGRAILSDAETATMLDDARKEFNAELALDPTNAGAEYVLGQIARKNEDWPEAIAHFARAAKLDSSFADAWKRPWRRLKPPRGSNRPIPPRIFISQTSCAGQGTVRKRIEKRRFTPKPPIRPNANRIASSLAFWAGNKSKLSLQSPKASP